MRVEGRFSDDAPWIHREGVLWHEPSQTDLLFVRERRREGGRAGGVAEPFRCLGFVRYESHEGERPIPAGWMQGMGLAV